jgi:hypothetical protein
MIATPFRALRNATVLEGAPTEAPNQNSVDCVSYSHLVVGCDAQATVVPYWWNPIDEQWMRDFSQKLGFPEGGGIARLSVLGTQCALCVEISPLLPSPPDPDNPEPEPDPQAVIPSVRLLVSLQRHQGI